MTGNEFEQFAEAANTAHRSNPLQSVSLFERVTVLGGGGDAMMLAALCLSEQAQVTLFSAYGEELDLIRNAGMVSICGSGPIGNYQVDQPAVPSIITTAELDKAVVNAEAIFLTGPVHKQRTYAMALADHIRDDQVLVLAPGRSFGAAEAAWLLRVGGCQADFTVIETQGLPYWYQAVGTRLTLSPVPGVCAATVPSQRQDKIQALARLFPNIEAVPNILHSSFNDGSGLVEVPALVLGGLMVGDGMPSIPPGGIPLDENRSFRALIGPQHRVVIQQLADERRRVAEKFGVRDLANMDQWLDTHAGLAKGESARPVPGQNEAIRSVRCATIASLVPLVSAATLADEAVPTTESIIHLACVLLGANVSSAGRRLESIGISGRDISDARRHLDAVARGEFHG
ncbi:MAG: hypothetical protein GKR95_01440 [Gammaproteobacteria bacterium]|nr:hypothetical protein [Gammaproteobacteria bacterium]